MKTLMRILSVIELILGAAALVLGTLNILAFQRAGLPEALTIAFAVVMAVLLMVGGVMNVLCGLLGLRAASYPERATAAIVFGVLALLPGAVRLFLDMSTQNLLGCILPALYLICAIGLKAGGKPETRA